ncbi:TPA: hypothetical protein DEO28_03900 [Candidatus Dependentiae bacterium]|nr:MAG: hypothetical protein UR14_C0006G0017 [candidate division TM6 bacterium GW2011_GWE2_31_21]KKP53560.1 MAG: hypothetical protein UR43_C0004G0101 [candidate division TM6 bacterium GW2011_GWF2_33_332]HBS48199.1 hypothetical protein [Candidatus Dependentiae bacterium]HBZ73625.1 hypothetical protein [Candidatus Dependentiae bacterium]
MKKQFNLFLLTFFTMFSFCSFLSAKIAFPLRFLGVDSVLKDIASVKNGFKDSLNDIEVIFITIQILLFLITFFLALITLFFFFQHLQKTKIQKFKSYLGQLRVEFALRNCGAISDVKKELFDLIENIVQKKYFLKMVDKSGKLRILETLEILKNKKISFEQEIILIDSLQKIVEGF